LILWRWNSAGPIRWAFVLSLLVHALLIFGWLPSKMQKPADDAEPGGFTRSLAVRLVPPAPPPVPPPPRASMPMLRADPVPERRPVAPRIAAAPAPAPRAPVIAVEPPATASVPTSPPVPVANPPPEDFAALVEARRRAREASQPPSSPTTSRPVESGRDEHNRMVARNLGLDRPPAFGGEQQRGGGIFHLLRVGRDDADFVFYGWNRAINRQSQQTIEVRRGTNASIELAIVRRMVQIIRDHEAGDFQWESQRLGRNVTLSARAADNAGLEDFLMRDFFTGFR
jgi:hypothetical protein